MTERNLTPHIGSMPAASLRAKSTTDLIQATHSAGDEGYILDRIRTVSDLYFKPEKDSIALAAAYDEYRKPLRDLPKWAVAKAFDDWVKTGTHRPTPAHIRILAEKAMRPITDELARREQARREQQEDQKPRDPEIAEKAERICQNAGFTAKRAMAVRQRPMARSEAELYQQDEVSSKPHWTQTVPANSPDIAALKRARMNNPLMRKGMIEAGNVDPETQEEHAYRQHMMDSQDPE